MIIRALRFLTVTAVYVVGFALSWLVFAAIASPWVLGGSLWPSYRRAISPTSRWTVRELAESFLAGLTATEDVTSPAPAPAPIPYTPEIADLVRSVALARFGPGVEIGVVRDPVGGIGVHVRPVPPELGPELEVFTTGAPGSRAGTH